ncbi:hypothetical protein BZA05DRAFT_384762 [Tricharina praecox]|uniref:uncharacterized protein n=1 Tax=Tricharina praecox TaxID=43433 RepID=UPI00221EA310|nr:uncharacterized protein BZA05DRAFT_384762 [Tricharina praecox]KAI5857774.1 hypothetical protein BZA05DRAFT_384762 [Tricharina praecox]
MPGHDRTPPPLPTPAEEETAALKARILKLEAELAQYRALYPPPPPPPPAPSSKPSISSQPTTTTLTPDEYIRYGRQLILPSIGLPGQLALKSSRILIVGVGGLGSPAALYLAAAGIGTLGLLDHDTVELSNLHRQILHPTSRVGLPKVVSAARALHDVNPAVNVIPLNEALAAENALDIVTKEKWDVVLDCTDHPALRYLVSDACVLAGIPLVSASALRMDGQIMVFNDPPGVGPCYRCVWPRPPPAESVVSCGEGGILGPVVGVMGVMQALEAVRLVVRRGSAGEHGNRMCFFSAAAETQWRSLKMRGKRRGCVACGETPAVTRDGITAGGMQEYIAFCGRKAAASATLLRPEQRLSVQQARTEVDSMDAVIVDVRDPTQFGICALPRSINVPFDQFASSGGIPAEMERLMAAQKKLVVVCRLGNDSQTVTKRVLDTGFTGEAYDVIGGIRQWAKQAPEDGVVEY